MTADSGEPVNDAGRLSRRGLLWAGAGALALGGIGVAGCSRTDETGAEVSAAPTPTPEVAESPSPGIPARTTYTFPAAAEPLARDLQAAGLPIVYGPNSVPAPAGISAQARQAWANNAQMPLPADDPVKLAAVRRFSARTEDIEYDKNSQTHLLEDRTLNGITTLWVTPRTVRHPDKLMVFIHGGAWILNSRRTQLGLQCAVADALGVRVVSLEYRLAPEHPYPAALDDIDTAYTAILKDYRAENIGVFGTSAGGGLTLATLLRLKATGRPLPAAAAALCPGADMTHTGYLFTAVGLNDPILSPRDIDICMRAFVAGADANDPLVSPVFGDYTGIPPLFLLASTAEIIGSDGIRVADTARSQGVDVTLLVSDGMWHVPIADGTGIPELQRAFDQMADFFRRQLQIVGT